MDQIGCDCDGPDCTICFMTEGDGFEEEIEETDQELADDFEE
jgi:hypothetical protein